MEVDSYINKFYCPHCGVLGSIYVLQLKRKKIVIKQRCPTHGGRKFKIPIEFKNELFPLIQKSIFRCHYCSEPTWIDQIKKTKPFILLKAECGTHGKYLPYQKIWESFFNELQIANYSSKPIQKKQHRELPKYNYCPFCGGKINIKRNLNYCELCFHKFS